MQIKNESVKGLKHSYKVFISPDIVQQKVLDYLQDKGAKVKLDGFRPGKAPIAVLRQKFGAEATQQTVSASAEDCYRKILSDKNIAPADSPEVGIDSFSEEKGIEISYNFEVLPVIKDVDFVKKVSFNRLVTKVDKKQIDAAIANILSRYKTTEPLKEKRPAKLQDTVVISFDGKTADGPISGGSGKDYHLELGSDSFIPGFEDKIVGMKVGDDRKISVSFPKDYTAKDLAGKKAEFAVHLTEIRKPVLPTLDDKFCKGIGFATKDDMLKKVNEILQVELDKISFVVAKKDTLDILAKEKFDVPEILVKKELDNLKKHSTSSKKDISDKELTKLQTKAERGVRLGLLLADIGSKNNVTISDKELHKAIEEEAMKSPGQEKQIIEYYTKNQAVLNSVRGTMFEDKVVRMIIDKASVKEKVVSKEELDKAMEAARKDFM